MMLLGQYEAELVDDNTGRYWLVMVVVMGQYGAV